MGSERSFFKVLRDDFLKSLQCTLLLPAILFHVGILALLLYNIGNFLVVAPILALFFLPSLLCLIFLVLTILKTPREIAKLERLSYWILFFLFLGALLWFALMMKPSGKGFFGMGEGKPAPLVETVGFYLIPALCAVFNFIRIVLNKVDSGTLPAQQDGQQK